MTICVYNKKIDENLSYETNLHEYFTDRMIHTDRFLRILADAIPNRLDEFLHAFQSHLKARIQPDLLPLSIKTINVEFPPTCLLEKQEELIYTLQKAMFTFMQFRNYEGTFTEASSVCLKFTDYYRGAFLAEYYMAQTLCELIGREAGLEIIKQYTRGYYMPPSFQPKHEPFLEDHANASITGSAATHQALYYCDNSRLFFKVDRCLYAEVILDLPDKELIYYLECYGDYFNHTAKNEHFVLTRTKTLMKGDKCCDFCYHDKRFIEEIYHPSDSEWERIEHEI